MTVPFNTSDETPRTNDRRLLTNKGLVLVYLAGAPDARISEIASAAGITERAAQRIVSQLVGEGYMRRKRLGRRNRYELVRDAPLGHPLLRQGTVGSLVDALAPGTALDR
jgi:DNA-binding MarR family transcriptional regulator